MVAVLKGDCVCAWCVLCLFALQHFFFFSPSHFLPLILCTAMNEGVPPQIPITYEPRLIQPLGLKQSSAFSHGDIYIYDLAANSSNLIVSASNHEIKLYSPATLTIKNVLKFHAANITQIKAHGEHILMSSSKDGSVAVWDLRTESQPVQIFTSKWTARCPRSVE